MKILFFDVETTGLPKDYKANITELDNWPRIVQIAYQYHDDREGGDPVVKKSEIVKPDGYEIPEASVAIHGISNLKAKSEGIPLNIVLGKFDRYVIQSDVLVAHNIDFDFKVVGSEYLRSGVPINSFIMLKRICTMKSTVQFCNIPGRYGPKWPSLQELHEKIFERGFDGGHDAGVDVQAMVDCFMVLKQDGFYDDKWMEWF